VLAEHIERAPRELIAYAQHHGLDQGPPRKPARRPTGTLGP
jgi:hypothetical protein